VVTFSAAFSGGPGYQDILIPPTVSGTPADLTNVNNIDLAVGLDTPGSSFTIDVVDAVSPEPSSVLLMTIGVLLMIVNRARRLQAPGRELLSKL